MIFYIKEVPFQLLILMDPMDIQWTQSFGLSLVFVPVPIGS